MKMAPDTSNPQRDRGTYAAAVKFGAAVVVAALVVLLAGLAWLSGCKSDTGSLHTCSAPQRYTLAIGPALVLLLGGLTAFVRTFRTWRSYGAWWVWQGAGWFL